MKLTKIAISLMLASLSSFVVAQDSSGFFVQGAVGRSNTSYNTLPQGYTGQTADTTWTLGGGYRFNENFGVESSYRNLGSLKITANTAGGLTGGATGDVSAWTAGGFAALPLGSNFELTARGGWYSWRMSEAWSYSSGVHGSKTSTGTDTYWGVGAAYLLDKQLSAVLNWTQFKSPSSNVKDGSVIEMGLQYRFGSVN
jgi:hypothetical protein